MYVLSANHRKCSKNVWQQLLLFIKTTEAFHIMNFSKKRNTTTGQLHKEVSSTLNIINICD